MIRADITTAALDEHTEQRVRIATSLLAAFRIDARVRAWDGTRCNLLIADVSDAYGRQACSIARRRSTPAVMIDGHGEPDDDNVAALTKASPAPMIAQAIRDLLIHHAAVATTPHAVEHGENAPPALCRLSSSPYLGRSVDATLDGHIVRIRPREGRVYAPTLSDLLSARDTFSIVDWNLDLQSDSSDSHTTDDASRSLEAFLLQCAHYGRGRLPPFPDGHYRLKDWPDIGSAPELIGALKVADRLLRGPASAEALREDCALDAYEVNAALWAYQAANLLEATDRSAKQNVPLRPAGNFSSMLSRIARRFGLGA